MEVERELEASLGARPIRLSALHKSSFGPTYRADFDGAASLFIKTDSPTDRFYAEADGLEVLAASGAIGVPAVIAVSDRLLVLEYIESVPPPRGFQRRFGEELASMHRVQAEHFGHRRDNFIGPLPQPNRAHDDFISFYRDERLMPMAERAGVSLGAEGRALLQRLIDELDDHLEMNEPPSLIHGDLWSGNFMCAEGGRPMIFDPAVAFSDRELDLAMLELFGGVGAEFYAGYDSIYPRREGWAERQPLYQLYYLLVHVALFGGSYIASTKRALRAILG